MDENNYLGSFADENVAFTTQVIRQKVIGDNYWKAMAFVENDRFVDSSAWLPVPGSTKVKALTVSAKDYAESTSGLLRSWLYDLFCNGFSGDCILVACGEQVTSADVTVYSADGKSFYTDAEMNTAAEIPVGKTPRATGTENEYVYTTYGDASAFIENMEAAYDLLKAYAYHKTVCAGGTFSVDPAIAVALAKKCASDKQLLSSAPYLPFTSVTPEVPESDELFSALKTAGTDAFMSYHADPSRNAALYSLGLALVNLNGSGTAVGTSLDMIKSDMITSSGPGGTVPLKTVKDALKEAHVQYFKPVGDNTPSVAATGDVTIKGEIVAADWIVAYVTYMTKVRIAQMITVPDFLRNADNYSKIVGVLSLYLPLFGESGSKRLTGMLITAPSFKDLPASDSDEVIIPNAWEATYVDHVRTIKITGALYIGG